MNLSVNGQSKVPPGFRFHPTEEELLHYYLRKKVACQKIDLDVIRDVDLNKLEPWDIQETCKIGSTPQNDWYFFSHKDKKYPTGTRTNRATAAGFWKATGRDKVIHNSMRRIGMRKTLVFYRGRAPHGLKSDWIMHEYRLDLDNDNNMRTSSHESTAYNASNLSGDSGSDEGWVVCRVFKKKNYHKSMGHSPLNLSTSHSTPRNEGVLDHILTYMGRPSSSSSSCKQENETNSIPLFSNIPSTPAFMNLPGLECPSSLSGEGLLISEIGPSSDWAEVDRLVASQLNGQPTKPFSGTDDEELSFCFNQHDEAQLLNAMMIESHYKVVPSYDHHLRVPNSSHLWGHDFGQPSSSSLSSSTSDPLCRFSV